MTATRLFVVLAALFAGLAAYFVPRVDASGDEPHYLVMAQSLWREHDLDLRDNYARQDWREFRSGPTEPHYASPRSDGRPFPGHAPGLPFALAPIYALGGRLLSAIFLGVLVGGVGALAFRAAHLEGRSAEAALLAGVIAAGPPLAAFSLHMYTESASALLVFGAYLALRFGAPRLGAALAAACASALPFLHPKMALASLAVAFAAFVWRDRLSLPTFAVVASMGGLAYGAFWMSIFGVPTGLGVYGGVPEDAALNPIATFLGLFVDRAYGLLPIAPVFAAIFLLDARAPRLDRVGRAELALVLSIALPILFWRMWWGGQSPPARLLAPAIPFLALWVARVWDLVASASARKVMIAAVAWSWALFLFAALQPDRLLFINKRVRPTRLWDALWPGGPLDAMLPDLVRPAPSDWTLALAWALGLCGLTLVLRHRRPSTPA